MTELKYSIIKVQGPHYKRNHCNIAIVLARDAQFTKKALHSSCNMGTCGLPDMLTLISRDPGVWKLH